MSARRARRGNGPILGAVNLGRVATKKGYRRITGKYPLLIKVIVNEEWNLDRTFQHKNTLYYLTYVGKSGNKKLMIRNLGDPKKPRSKNAAFNSNLDRYIGPLDKGDVVYIYMNRWNKTGFFRVMKNKAISELLKKDRKNTKRFIGLSMEDENEVIFTTHEEEFGTPDPEEQSVSAFEHVIASAMEENESIDDQEDNEAGSLFPHFT